MGVGQETAHNRVVGWGGGRARDSTQQGGGGGGGRARDSTWWGGGRARDRVGVEVGVGQHTTGWWVEVGVGQHTTGWGWVGG